MGVAPDLLRKPGGNPVVVLPQPQPMAIRQLDQALSGAFQKLAVRGSSVTIG